MLLFRRLDVILLLVVISNVSVRPDLSSEATLFSCARSVNSPEFTSFRVEGELSRCTLLFPLSAKKGVIATV